MHCQPHRGSFRIGPRDAVPLVYLDLEPVSRTHTDQSSILELQLRRAFYQQHEFLAVLVVPALLWRGMAQGEDTFDRDITRSHECLESFFG